MAGLGAATLAVLTIRHGWGDIAAIIAVLVLGALIGILQGTIFAKLGVPAFVVTLAGSIGWLGLQLFLLRPEGTINLPYDGTIAKITHTNLSPAAGWIIAILAIGIYAAVEFFNRSRRLAAGLPAISLTQALIRVVGLAILIGAAVAVLNSWQGVPLALLILVGITALVEFVLKRTRYGRSIFAVGGNAEAARRAGINITAIRISVFALASLLAAFGGIMLASRGYSAGQSTGANDTTLIAIAAAVIGGVSLFGGRGSTYGALLGTVVLGSITSGMFLLQLDSSIRLMITAAVLLAAVILDALSRRGRKAHGRA